MKILVVLGVTRFEWFGHDIANTLNSEFLEPVRQVDALADRVRSK